MRLIDCAGWFRDDGDELCSFLFSRDLLVKWLSIRERGHDVGLLSILADSLNQSESKTKQKENVKNGKRYRGFWVYSSHAIAVARVHSETYSIAFRYRQKKSGRIRYLYNSSSHSFKRSASLFDILSAFGMLNGPSASPWNSGILLKKSHVCLKLSGVPHRCCCGFWCFSWSLRSLFVPPNTFPKLMPKNPLTFVELLCAEFFLLCTSKWGIFGQKFASLRSRLSASSGVDVVKVFSPWYCS